MKIGFRQGIIKGQRLPDFLIKNGNSVSFNASKMPTLLNFAEGSSNYLVYEKVSVDDAWTVPNQQECWLYWDISKETATRSFGYTTSNPFIKEKPISPELNQMFFDTVSMHYQTWNGQLWVDTIRLIAGHISSDGNLKVQSNGSQIDVVMPVTLDEIIFDINGLPIKKYTDSGFEFYNKFNISTYTVDNRNSFTYDRILKYNGKAEVSIPKYSCVTWKNSNSLELADPTKSGKPAFALVERDANTDEIVSVISSGFVTNRLTWNWPDPVNTPIFVGANGSITTTVDSSVSIQRIGYIVSPNTIYLSFNEQYIEYMPPPLFPTPSVTV